MTTTNKNILLGISGGIAAYKIPMLVRLFVKNGYNVRIVATQNALRFVSELTLQTLSSYRVYSDMFATIGELTTEHIALCSWADIMVVAPCSADIIGKYSAAIADDALSTTLLAFDGKVIMAPAMNSVMYQNEGVRHNIDVLKQRGVEFVEATEGFLACGSTGVGRMAEVETIFDSVKVALESQQDFCGKTLLITAGPTVEPIDSVRYISNRSTGKMGYAIANRALKRGARVKLVSGPVNVKIAPCKNLELIEVDTAENMYKASLEAFKESDVAICTAAVADYSPESCFEGKMKKSPNSLTINLKPTKDILKTLGQNKGDKILVGFALETDNEQENAKHKLESKNLDFIVLNSLKDSGAGFGFDTNKVTIFDSKGSKSLPLMSKQEVAKNILDKILTFF